MLEKIISSFIVISGTKHIFVGIDSTVFKITHASQYYTDWTGYRRKYAKLSIRTDVLLLQQIICTVKIRWAHTRHDDRDFKPVITRIAEILPLSVVTADKGYDSEANHLLVREELHAFSISLLDANTYRYGEHMVSTESRWNMVTLNCCTINETRMKL